MWSGGFHNQFVDRTVHTPSKRIMKSIEALVAAKVDVHAKNVVRVGGGQGAGRTKRGGGLVEIFEPEGVRRPSL
jgi:hypothetical protein